MAFIDDVAAYLEDGGVGVVGTDIFTPRIPDSPDACLVVIDTGGFSPDEYVPIENPTFQIYVRAVTYDIAKAKIDAAVERLQRAANFTSGGTYFYYVLATGHQAFIGEDKNGRNEFTVNFRCKVR